MAQNTKGKMIRRVFMLGVLLTILIGVIGVRLFQFQIVEGAQSLEAATKSTSESIFTAR